MKHIYTTFLLVIIVTSVSAQGTLSKNSNQINAGVGVSRWGVPVYFGFDHGLANNISVGGELTYSHYRERWNTSYYNHNVLGLSANANYHFNQVLELEKNLDIYAGLNLGYYFLFQNNDGFEGYDDSQLALGLQVGGRYFFTPRVALNVELGGNTAFTFGKLGVTIKLK